MRVLFYKLSNTQCCKRGVEYNFSFFCFRVCREKINVHALCVVAMIDKGISVLDKPCDFVEVSLYLVATRKYPLHGYILGVLTHKTARD